MKMWIGLVGKAGSAQRMRGATVLTAAIKTRVTATCNARRRPSLRRRLCERMGKAYLKFVSFRPQFVTGRKSSAILTGPPGPHSAEGRRGASQFVTRRALVQVR